KEIHALLGKEASSKQSRGKKAVAGAIGQAILNHLRDPEGKKVSEIHELLSEVLRTKETL
ncbi:unnamed protein product, partial [Amoebophrya sp. A25]